MNIVISLVKRNLKIFLRNRTAVFFSFLSIIIIIGLYALFLGDVQVANIKAYLGEAANLVNEKDIAWLVNSWVMAGLISVNCITIVLGTYGTIVDDIENGINKDFLSAPIKRSHVVLGYIVSSWILAVLLSLIGFIVIEIYVVSQGGAMLSLIAMIQTFLIILLTVISFSAVLFFIVSFIKSANAFGTLSSIIGTLIGFLAGIYIPVGILPDFAKIIVSIFPVSYSASMLRRVYLDEPLQKVFSNNPEALNIYNDTWGVKLYINGQELGWIFMICAILIIGFIFYVLSVFRVKNNKLS